MVGKALAQVDGAVSQLAPELDPIEEARRFFLRSISRRLAGRLDPQQIIYEVERLRYRASQVSDGLATVVGGRPGRQLEVKFTSARLEQKVVRAGRAVALGLGAGLTWVAATQASASIGSTPGFRGRCAASPAGSRSGSRPRSRGPASAAEHGCGNRPLARRAEATTPGRTSI